MRRGLRRLDRPATTRGAGRLFDRHARILVVAAAGDAGRAAIAAAIASERPRCRITGVDISPPALDVAMQNSRDLGFAHIDWRLGSWFDPVPGERFDLIVANPPYIAAPDPALEQLAAERAVALCASPPV